MALAEEKVYTEAMAGNVPGAEAKLAEMVFRTFEASRKAIEPFHKACRRVYTMYHSRHALDLLEGQHSVYPYEVKLHIPTVLEQVETAVPRLARSLLDNDPMVRQKPTLATTADQARQEELVEWAKINARMQHNQLLRDVKIRRNLPAWVRDSKLYGIKWLFLNWKTTKAPVWRQKRVGTTETWKLEKSKDAEVLEDRVNVEDVSVWDAFPDPRARSTDTLRYFDRQVVMPADDLWEYIEGTRQGKTWKVKKFDELKAVMGEVRGSHDTQITMLTEIGKRASDQGEGWMPKDEDKRQVRIIDHWEPKWHVMLAGKKSGRSSIAASGGQEDATWRVLLVEPNPFRRLRLPVVAVVPEPKSNEIVGLGVDDTILKLAHYVNLFANLYATNLARSVNGLFIVNTMSGLNAQMLLSQPAGSFNVDGSIPLSECVQKFDFAMADNDTPRTLDFWLQHIQLAGGATDAALGANTGGVHETARGMMALLEQGGARFNIQMQMIATCLGDLAQAMHALNRQFMTKPRLVQVIGEDGADMWLGIDPEIIDRDYLIEFDCRPEAANPALQFQQWVNLGQIVSQFPELNRLEFLKESFRRAGEQRPWRFLNQQINDAAAENLTFRARGMFHAAAQGDDHEGHAITHQILRRDGTAKKFGKRGEDELETHMLDHLRFGGMLQGGQGMQAPGAGPGGQGGPGGPPGGGQPMPSTSMSQPLPGGQPMPEQPPQPQQQGVPPQMMQGAQGGPAGQQPF